MSDEEMFKPVQCRFCTKFFAQYSCAKNWVGECDCPKCQGMCECHDLKQPLTDEQIDDIRSIIAKAEAKLRGAA